MKLNKVIVAGIIAIFVSDISYAGTSIFNSLLDTILRKQGQGQVGVPYCSDPPSPNKILINRNGTLQCATCPSGSTYQNGYCTTTAQINCPSGSTYQNGVCVAQQSTSNCSNGFVLKTTISGQTICVRDPNTDATLQSGYSKVVWNIQGVSPNNGTFQGYFVGRYIGNSITSHPDYNSVYQQYVNYLKSQGWWEERSGIWKAPLSSWIWQEHKICATRYLKAPTEQGIFNDRYLIEGSPSSNGITFYLTLTSDSCVEAPNNKKQKMIATYSVSPYIYTGSSYYLLGNYTSAPAYLDEWGHRYFDTKTFCENIFYEGKTSTGKIKAYCVVRRYWLERNHFQDRAVMPYYLESDATVRIRGALNDDLVYYFNSGKPSGVPEESFLSSAIEKIFNATNYYEKRYYGDIFRFYFSTTGYHYFEFYKDRKEWAGGRFPSCVGKLNSIYDNTTNPWQNCVDVIITVYFDGNDMCPSGMSYNSNTGRCEASPNISCPSGYSFNQQLGKCVSSPTYSNPLYK